jgi:hypothetical protein
MGKLGPILWMASCCLVALPCASARQEAELNPAALAALIDRRLEEKWQGVQPAPAADDAEFARRVYLDLAGRIPRVQEIRDFLEDAGSDRRGRLVERLLESPQYIGHLSTTWWNLFIASANNQQLSNQTDGFKDWLREQVRNNVSYAKVVRDILTAPLPNAPNALGVNDGDTGPSPAGFLLANQLKAENLAASTSRIFMGVKLECAQCHDHPFARWSRSQFWEMAAFFSNMQPRVNDKDSPERIVGSEPGQIRIPGSDTLVRAKFLTGANPRWESGAEQRTLLADWLTARDNPYFARAAVNRLWAHFFGLGLIDPVDDEPTDENPIRHPELLTELAQQFVAHDYDVKYMMRAVTATRAYQRTSSQSHASQADLRAFARMAVRGLTPEQIYDSIALATGFKEGRGAAGGVEGPGNLNTARGYFLGRFAGQERSTEKQTSILQALVLMNGSFVADATGLDRSAILAAVADAPFMSDPQKIETLYLAALGRLPTPDETRRLSAFVSAGGPRNDPRRALGDIFWALLNSSEFILNH